MVHTSFPGEREISYSAFSSLPSSLNKFFQTEDNFMAGLNYVSTRHAKSLCNVSFTVLGHDM